MFVTDKIILNTYNKVIFIVAHPDDETIFFDGLIQRLLNNGITVEVLCVNNSKNSTRVNEFFKTCLIFGIKAYFLDFEETDTSQLPIHQLARNIKIFLINYANNRSIVITQGI